ncbi:cilia- and flagella-associated protein 107-like [Saccopteryx leptura]|uniref:cilia- and flagella-associated protein 107-like n=1 Tax=Saccopteryx leptura TaxID=249018 RepID=UPI00339C11FD
MELRYYIWPPMVIMAHRGNSSSQHKGGASDGPGGEGLQQKLEKGRYSCFEYLIFSSSPKTLRNQPESVYRKEYVPFPGHRPDQIARWYGKKRIEGLPYKHLITHHQEPSCRYLISTYDDHYNRHAYNPGLPSRRTWDRHKLLWLPEKADFPLLAPPMNYGLYEQLKQRWLLPKAGLGESTYTSSYLRPPLCALSLRKHAILVPPPRLHPVPRF